MSKRTPEPVTPEVVLWCITKDLSDLLDCMPEELTYEETVPILEGLVAANAGLSACLEKVREVLARTVAELEDEVESVE